MYFNVVKENGRPHLLGVEPMECHPVPQPLLQIDGEVLYHSSDKSKVLRGREVATLQLPKVTFTNYNRVAVENSRYPIVEI